MEKKEKIITVVFKKNSEESPKVLSIDQINDIEKNLVNILSSKINQKNPEIKIDDYDNIYLLWEDVDVYNLLFRYKSYPKDITIGIGSPYGLDVPGYFSSVYPVETGLDLQLNSIVSDCQCPFCIINGDDCTFTMKLGSSSAGQIDIQDLKIVYTE